MRIVGRHVGALPARASLRDGESWFLGNVRLRNRLSDTVGEFADREAVQQLESFEYDDDLGDLLPYVLDAYGPGSRASVMKDPGTQPSRQAKRAAGVFYTPSDVAEYIARETLGGVGHTTPHRRVLDPACGSAVFLKAVLDLTSRRKPDMNRLDFAERNLHGIDINPLAVESACFVLLHECLRAGDGQPGESPWACWHRVRCNLCVADALTFQIATPHPGCADDLAHLRSRLAEGYVSPAAEPLDADGSTMLFPAGRTLGNVFPALSAGAEIVIGNPPYARIGRRDDTAALKRRFETLSGDVAASDYFPVFIEMMWRFARTGCSASGMVAPLSLACSSRAQMTAARRAIMRSGGRWRFAFFDREPHALFGEEVKTRNTIVFRHTHADDADSPSAIETGPLQNWTSRQRARLFDAIAFTPLVGDSTSIVPGIPKIDGIEPARVFSRLARRATRLSEMCVSVSSCPPEDVVTFRGDLRVFVAGTAYSFLNVFRKHRSLPAQRAPWSASRVLALEFSDEDEAARAFALLRSRVAYWLWRVLEDGFHVTRSFVTSLPFNDRILDETARARLALLGSRLWDRVQSHQVVSINRGRQTVAYRPDTSEDLRDEIDTLLLGALGVAPSFVDYTRTFARAAATPKTRRIYAACD